MASQFQVRTSSFHPIPDWVSPGATRLVRLITDFERQLLAAIPTHDVITVEDLRRAIVESPVEDDE
jgi:hypothetical protein